MEAALSQLELVPEVGPILLPYAAYQQEAERGMDRTAGGVQLVGFDQDKLTALGRVRSVGQPRFARLHHDHVLSTGDQYVETFAIADGQSPTPSFQLSVQQYVTSALQLEGGDVARVFRTADNLASVLELTTDEQAPDPSQRLSALSLPELLTTAPALTCRLQFQVLHLRTFGNMLYLVFSAYAPDRRVGVMAIDITDRRAPRLAGKVDWSTAEWMELDAGYVAHTNYVWNGRTLLVPEQKDKDTPRRLRVVDLSAPAKPHVAFLALTADPYVNVLSEGDLVLASRYHVAPDITRASFYVDRIDVSDPRAPRLVSSVNTPGALLQAKLTRESIVRFSPIHDASASSFEAEEYATPTLSGAGSLQRPRSWAARHS